MRARILSGLVCILLLAGCGQRGTFVVTPSYTTGRGDVVQGGFAVSLPKEWRELAVWENDETDTTYGLSFYEPRSREAGFGGWLFSLLAFPEGLEYDQYPDYKLVGLLTTGDGFTEHLVAIYPTDVEFTEEAAQVYLSLYEQIPEILKSVTANGDYTFQAQ